VILISISVGFSSRFVFFSVFLRWSLISSRCMFAFMFSPFLLIHHRTDSIHLLHLHLSLPFSPSVSFLSFVVFWVLLAFLSPRLLSLSLCPSPSCTARLASLSLSLCLCISYLSLFPSTFSVSQNKPKQTSKVRSFEKKLESDSEQSRIYINGVLVPPSLSSISVHTPSSAVHTASSLVVLNSSSSGPSSHSTLPLPLLLLSLLESGFPETHSSSDRSKAENVLWKETAREEAVSDSSSSNQGEERKLTLILPCLCHIFSISSI